MRDGARLHLRETDLELIAVETHRHVELEARGHDGVDSRDVLREKRHHAGGEAHQESLRILWRAVDRDEHAAGRRQLDRPRPGREGRAIGLDQLEGIRRAVAGADRLIERRRGLARRAGPVAVSYTHLTLPTKRIV